LGYQELRIDSVARCDHRCSKAKRMLAYMKKNHLVRLSDYHPRSWSRWLAVGCQRWVAVSEWDVHPD
jgi:hypothetical protein